METDSRVVVAWGWEGTVGVVEGVSNGSEVSLGDDENALRLTVGTAV